MSANEAVYAAEQLAFAGSPLADHFDRTSLMAETLELAEHRLLRPIVGDVTVEETSVRYAQFAAEAVRHGNRVRFAPNVLSRYVAVHELSHLAHYRSGLPQDGHGPHFRACYVDLVAAAYGDSYGRVLREAFHECDLEVAPVSIVLPDADPIIDIDRLTDGGSGRRWL